MNGEIQRYEDARLRELLDRERELEARAEELARHLSGMVDLDQALELAAVRAEAANRLLELLAAGPAESEAREMAELARREAEQALDLVDGLRSANISEDQRDLLSAAPGYARVRELLQKFLLAGGAGLLESRAEDGRRSKLLARAVSDSIRKHAAPDDRYEQAFRTESLPGWLRSLVRVFLPVLARERQQEPPYGIEEGQEQVYWSEKMKMPLSQAIHYLSTEVEPRLRQSLAADPANRELQRQLALLEDKLREYRSISLKPRATPINLEKGFYTDQFASFTADGELLVSVALPVISRSGTNLDRLRELVQNEIVRRLAGRGVCPRLDEDYRYRRSLASGRRGSWRLPGFKLDYDRGLQALKDLYPALKRLEDRQEFARLVEEVRAAGRRGGQRAVERLLEQGPQDRLRLP